MEFIFAHVIFYLTLFIFGSYLLLGIFSAIALRKYLRKNSYINYNSLVLSPLSPKISIIAPAFNESKTIIDNIRTLLSLYYNNFEVVIVNDGSTDNTLELVKESYDLVRDIFDVVPMRKIKVKGKEAPQQIYAVLGRLDDAGRPSSIEELRARTGIAALPESAAGAAGELVTGSEVKYEIVEQ